MSMKINMEILNQTKRPTLARKRGKKTRLYIDNEFLAEGYAAKNRKLSLVDVYAVLCKYANAKKQTCFPSIETIMRESGLKNRNAVVKALKKLEELNIINVWHSLGRSPNHYFLNDTSVWLKEDGTTRDTVEQYQKHHGTIRI